MKGDLRIFSGILIAILLAYFVLLAAGIRMNIIHGWA